MNRLHLAALISLSVIASPAIWAAGPTKKPAKLLVAAKPAPPPQPKARYVMDVSTNTGLGAMGGGLGGLGMLLGGSKSAKEVRLLDLRLGSTQAPASGGPQADHFFVPAAKMGKSVPLVSSARPEEPDGIPGNIPRDYQRPRGRLLLFWGCGAHAPKGQPVVIDFAKIAAGQMPPGLGLIDARVPVDRGPWQGNSRTFGHWPNGKGGKPPGSGSSLLGEHRIAGNYAPEIKFTLTQDYMPGLLLKSSSAGDGSINLSWNALAPATGYFAWAMGFEGEAGSGQPRDMVWWSSSASRAFGGGLTDWLPPEAVERLVADRTVMPRTQTSCTIPAEAKAVAKTMMMGNLYAYGPEVNFAYPPRPTAPGTPWVPEWTAKARFRSMSMVMLGSPMFGR